ncbi:MAG: ATP-dependent zinc protease [Betaproteobacteria bacterium]|nr:ATP-dependent zinc protease [Betaproteobacteria bacterium]
MNSMTQACVALLLLLSTTSAADVPRPRALPIAGWLERARLAPGNVVLEAKLDSGARTSSLHAMNLQQFKRDGKDWVAFDVSGAYGRSVRIERPLVRVARIKSALGADEGRPTVTLGICIGRVYRVTEVNLVDRSSLATPLLVGRRFLKGRLLVDLNRRYLLEPACTRSAMP